MRIHDRGSAQTHFLIALVVLFISAMGFAWLQAQEARDNASRLDASRTAQADLEDRLRRKVDELESICRATGYFDPEAAQAEKNDTVIRDGLDLIRCRLEKDLPVPTETCKALIDELARQVEIRNRRLHESELNLELRDRRIEEAETARARLLAERDSRIQELRRQLDLALRDKESRVFSFERQCTDLRERIRSLSAENERLGEEHRAQTGALQEDLGALRARIQALSERERIERPLTPDGRIVRADPDQGFVYLDLGEKDGLRSGRRFHVYSLARGGRRVEKGEVRVIRTERDLSQCAILSLAPEAGPITAGDFVWNRFFVRGRSLRIVFLGKFGTEGAPYDVERMRRMVAEAGHVATEAVGADTAWAVLGEGYENDPRFRRVRDYGVESLSPRELLESMGVGSFE